MSASHDRSCVDWNDPWGYLGKGKTNPRNKLLTVFIPHELRQLPEVRGSLLVVACVAALRQDVRPLRPRRPVQDGQVVVALVAHEVRQGRRGDVVRDARGREEGVEDVHHDQLARLRLVGRHQAAQRLGAVFGEDEVQSGLEGGVLAVSRWCGS